MMTGLKINKRIRSNAFIAGIILTLAVLLIIGFIAAKTTRFAKTAPSPDQLNTVGNTAANLLNEGFATMQGDQIYYVNTNSAGTDYLMAMAWNGENKRQLYASEGDLSELNAVGDDLYFVGRYYTADPWEDHGQLINTAIYRFNLRDQSADTIYTTTDNIAELFVLENKLYFNVQSLNYTGEIFSADLDGGNLISVIKAEQPFYSFAVLDKTMYYAFGDSNPAMASCDLDGGNQKNFTDGSQDYSLGDSRIYFVNSSDDSGFTGSEDGTHPVVKTMALDGSKIETIIENTGIGDGIGDLNYTDGILYYIGVDATYIDIDETAYYNEIFADDLRGSVKKIAEVNDLIYGLCVCGDWLFYYDHGKKETVIIQL